VKCRYITSAGTATSIVVDHAAGHGVTVPVGLAIPVDPSGGEVLFGLRSSINWLPMKFLQLPSYKWHPHRDVGVKGEAGARIHGCQRPLTGHETGAPEMLPVITAVGDAVEHRGPLLLRWIARSPRWNWETSAGSWPARSTWVVTTLTPPVGSEVDRVQSCLFRAGVGQSGQPVPLVT